MFCRGILNVSILPDRLFITFHESTTYLVSLKKHKASKKLKPMPKNF